MFLKVCFSGVMGWVEVLAMPEVRSREALLGVCGWCG
jgi:hypothetical protein